MAQENKKENKSLENPRNKEKPKETARPKSSPMREELGRLFDQDFWLEPLDFFRRTQRMLSRAGMGAFPKVDVTETDKEVKVTADIPGIDPDDIDIEIHADWMRISGRVERETESDERPYRYERAYGAFRRGFMLPSRVKQEGAKAVYKNGTLSITLPKEEESRKNRIKIEKQ